MKYCQNVSYCHGYSYRKIPVFKAISSIPILDIEQKSATECKKKKRSNRTKCMGFLLSPLKATADVIWLFNQPIDNHFACLPF